MTILEQYVLVDFLELFINNYPEDTKELKQIMTGINGISKKYMNMEKSQEKKENRNE